VYISIRGEEGEHQLKLNVDGKSDAKSQINTVQQHAAI
jgi:hypothetical protein